MTGGPTMRTSGQMQKMKTQPGFVAALDQSGGSTPHALALYGIKDHAWKDDDEMFELVHHMRTRVITSTSFTGERILGATHRFPVGAASIPFGLIVALYRFLAT